MIHDKTQRLDKDKFKLVLYVSFTSRPTSTALTLFEALEEYCNKNGLTNFELHKRISSDLINEQRWDEKYVLKEMKKYFPTEVGRVWVCGPPSMNETFERAFDTVAFKNYGFRKE